MSLFQYEAVDKVGKKVKGVISADSIEQAKGKMQRQDLLITLLKTYKKQHNKVVLKTPLLLSFTREMALLLHAGLPLFEALQTIEEKYRSLKEHSLFLDLCDKVGRGYSLSQVLQLYEKSFSPIYIAMVASGEESGRLESVLQELSLLIEKQDKARKKITSLLIYPSFLFAFAGVILIALFFFLVPAMSELFEGRSLHPITETVLMISRFLRNHTYLFGTGLVVFFGTIALMLFNRSVKGRLKQMLLHLPVCRKMVSQSVLSRFARSFAVLLGVSVPMVQALRLSKQVLAHPSFEALLEKTEQSVIEGKKISSVFATSPLIPRVFIRMLLVAEEAGTVPVMLKHIAYLFEEELDRSVSRFLTLLQPLLLLVLGLVVGLILLSILLPLTDVSSFMN